MIILLFQLILFWTWFEEVCQFYILIESCEVVPFLGRNNLIFMGATGAIYTYPNHLTCQRVLAMPSAVGNATGCWQCHRLLATAISATWLVSDAWLIADTWHSPSPRYVYIWRREEENNTNIHAGFAACFANTYAGFAVSKTIHSSY